MQRTAVLMREPIEPNLSDRRTFEVFRDSVGHWCARRQDGLVNGTFFEREAALRFVRHENLWNRGRDLSN